MSSSSSHPAVIGTSWAGATFQLGAVGLPSLPFLPGGR